MKKILITRKLLPLSETYALKIFDAKINKEDKLFTQEDLIENSKDCDGILSSLTEKIDANVIEKLSDKVKIISNFGGLRPGLKILGRRLLGAACFILQNLFLFF